MVPCKRKLQSFTVNVENVLSSVATQPPSPLSTHPFRTEGIICHCDEHNYLFRYKTLAQLFEGQLSSPEIMTKIMRWSIVIYCVVLCSFNGTMFQSLFHKAGLSTNSTHLCNIYHINLPVLVVTVYKRGSYTVYRQKTKHMVIKLHC